MIITIDEKKAFHKIQWFSVIKTLNKLSVEETHCNTRKATQDQLTTKITLSNDQLKALPLRSEKPEGPILTTPTPHSDGRARQRISTGNETGKAGVNTVFIHSDSSTLIN